MDEVTQALTCLSPLTAYFTEWALEAMDLWNSEHSQTTKARMRPVSRDDYIYDQIIGITETASFPFPIKILKRWQMRLLSFRDGDIEILLWPKKLDPTTYLTRNYPTPTALARQQSMYELPRSVLIIYGHTIGENLFDPDAWIDRVIFTRESRDDDGTRGLTLIRTIYTQSMGQLPIRVDDPQMELFRGDLPAIPATPGPLLPPPIIRPRKSAILPAATVNEPPKVGPLESRRAENSERQKELNANQDDLRSA